MTTREVVLEHQTCVRIMNEMIERVKGLHYIKITGHKDRNVLDFEVIQMAIEMSCTVGYCPQSYSVGIFGVIKHTLYQN